MNVVARRILGHRLDIDGVVGAVNNWCSRYAIWTDIAAGQARGRSFSIGEDPGLPQDSRRTAANALRIHRVDGVVFRGHVQNVFVSLSGDRKLAEEERLAVNLAIDGEFAFLPERNRVHFPGGHHRLGGCHAPSRTLLLFMYPSVI